MLELHKIIKSFTRSCVPNCFFSFYQRGRQRGVTKVMKNNHFLVFQPFGSFFPSFEAGKGMIYIKIALNDKSVTYSYVRNRFFFCFMSEVDR